MEQHLTKSLADAFSYVINKNGYIVKRGILDIAKGIAEKEEIDLEDAYFELMEFSFCQKVRMRPDGEEDESASYIMVGEDKVLRIKVTEDFEDLCLTL